MPSTGKPMRRRGGAGVASFVPSLLYGSSMNNPRIDPWTVHQLNFAMPSRYEQLYLTLSSEIQFEQQSQFKFSPPNSNNNNSIHFITITNITRAFEIIREANKHNVLRYPNSSSSISSDNTTWTFPLPFHNALYAEEAQRVQQEDAVLRDASTPSNNPQFFYNIFGVLIDTPLSVEMTPNSNSSDSNNSDNSSDSSSDDLSYLLKYRPSRYSDFVSGDGLLPVETTMGDNAEALFSPDDQQQQATSNANVTGLVRRAGLRASHNWILNAPDVHTTLEHFLQLSCPWEGLWNVSILKPTRYVEQIRVHQSGWDNIWAEEYNLRSTEAWGSRLLGTIIGSYGNATFEWVQDSTCMSWHGYWRYPWVSPSSSENPEVYVWTGQRIIGNECNSSTSAQRRCEVANGQGTQTCQYGFWESGCNADTCDEGYVLSRTFPARPNSCVLRTGPPPPQDQGGAVAFLLRWGQLFVVIVIFSVAIAVAVAVVARDMFGRRGFLLALSRLL